MLDNLFNLIKSSVASQPLLHLANIIASVENLVKLVGLEYTKTNESKNAAIDELINILKSHKDPILPA